MSNSVVTMLRQNRERQREGEIVDRDAIEIGRLYKLARTSIVESVRCQIECGWRLAIKKALLKHGEWLAWLKDNAAVLGFETRQTAARLIRLVPNGALAHHLNEIKALPDAKTPIDTPLPADLTSNLDPIAAAHMSRKTWGHTDSQLVQQSLSNDHYTPEKYIEAARTVMGAIDLDPASCAKANEVVKAKQFFSAKDNGLDKEWRGRVWLNPPYGRLVGCFIEKLNKDLKARRVVQAVVLVNAHCTDTEWFQPLWDGTLCFTDHRINFYGDDKRSGSTHGSAFVYFGDDSRAFVKHFAEFGPVVARVQP